ncbi:SDR family oxidoreductase [Halomonas sp. WWR20]
MRVDRFENKVVLVTGGNSGIGLASAKAFHQEGAKVIITGRNPDTLEKASLEIGEGTLALRSDIADLNALDTVMETIRQEHGRLDVLFANAALGKLCPFDHVTESFYDEVMNTNLKGTFFTVQKAVPLMPFGSAIVLNSSIGAREGKAHSSVYSASKAGVQSLGRTLATELIQSGIRVNVCSPGPIDTPLPHRMTEFSHEEILRIKEDMKEWTLLKRLGTAEEAAAPVLFLASDEASNIVAIDLVVDGGATNL